MIFLSFTFEHTYLHVILREGHPNSKMVFISEIGSVVSSTASPKVTTMYVVTWARFGIAIPNRAHVTTYIVVTLTPCNFETSESILAQRTIFESE